MKICCLGQNFKYELEKLARIFLPFEKIEMLDKVETADRYAVVEQLEKDGEMYARAKLFLNGKIAEKQYLITPEDEDFGKVCERVLATALFDCFIEITGYKPEWGILTGVRPAKLFSRLSKKMGVSAACNYFENELKVSKNKISLCMDAVRGESAITSLSNPDNFSLYLSVPFCPTRCSYCSFVSHSVDKAQKLIPQYVELLCCEIEETGKSLPI